MDTQKDFRTNIKLPLTVFSPSDISRLRRSASDLADYITELLLKDKKQSLPKPRAGLLAEFALLNELDLTKVSDCKQAVNKLSQLQKLAPVVHISFASEPSAKFIQKIVSWFRDNIHPLLLVTVGLQPSVAAGCYLRTTNQYFDLSLRRYLSDKKPELAKTLRGLSQK